MPGPRPSSFEFGRFRLDTAEHMLSRDGSRLPLTPKVYDVLTLLIENAGHLVEKERLLEEVWPNTFVEEGALTRSISVLRKTLGETAADKYIETVPKRGYRFIAPVTRGTGGESAPPTRRLPASRLLAIGAVLLLVALVSPLVMQLARPPVPSAIAEHRQVTASGNDGGPTLSNDGRQIAYISATATEKRLMIQQVDGGQPVSIYAAPELGYLRWSPDGSQLLYWTRGSGDDGIYTIAPPGGTPRLIRRGPFVGCWSPDGKTIAMTSYKGLIWLHDLAGNELRTLTLRDVTWSIRDLDWSSVDERLLFVSNDAHGAHALWTISPDGAEQRKLFDSPAEISAARWNENGTAIYFLERSNQTASVKKWWPATGEHVPVLSGLESGHSFGISRDGTRLAYARAPFHSNLWRLDITRDGGNGPATTELTRGTSLIERPRISPDGTRVLFNRGHQPRANLFTMPIAGGPMKQITFLDSFNVGGVWSRNGTRVAFASTEGGSPRVWIVSAEGGPPQPLAAVAPGENLDLAWSPGRRILFQQAGNRNYHALDPDSRDQHLVAKDSSVGWMFSPAYSPDGRVIAVSWNRRPDRGIWIVDAHDRTERFVHKAGAGTMVLGWAADGNAIYAVEGKNAVIRGPVVPLGETISDARIIEIPLNGAPVKMVAALPGAEIGGVTMAPDARRFVYAVYSSRSDVWVVDNFDAALARRSGRQP
jgi:Tol biopolymer transport system component/DNA-binding winged helix-turn-helix (wHTH) protein